MVRDGYFPVSWDVRGNEDSGDEAYAIDPDVSRSRIQAQSYLDQHTRRRMTAHTFYCTPCLNIYTSPKLGTVKPTRLSFRVVALFVGFCIPLLALLYTRRPQHHAMNSQHQSFCMGI